MFNFKLFTLFVLTLLFVSYSIAGNATETNVVSENIIHLQNDGKSYLLHRTMRTDSPQYEFHVDKEHKLDKFYYISPNNYEWNDESNELTNVLKFPQGNFVVMYPGEFNNSLSIDENGIYHFKSWDGEKRDDGLFGYWNSPGDFTSFVYVWVIPEHFEIVSYKSNREGNWVTRDNSITYFGSNTNNLTFDISYRLLDSDKDGVSDNKDYCLDTIANAPVDKYGCDADSDLDGVVDHLDQCPTTAAGLTVNTIGCELDTDQDGVVDSLDQCPTTAAGLTVNTIGCELDSDKDGVVDSLDQCPTTAAGLTVNATGCELDSDKDGVVDSLDQCPTTAAGLTVNAIGCELDSDKDGVVDSLDQCPTTAAGLTVNATGCELDSDKDGVVDSLDQCPTTAAGLTVNAIGCELDSDKDGVVDSLDQCPTTAAGLTVNTIGCELDTDQDGVVDSQDQCPTTAAGLTVNAVGCELDTDQDGVVDSLDQCPTTAAGLTVNTIGCELDTDQDGVVDSLDQCPTTAAGLAVDAIGCELDRDKDGIANEKDLCPDTALNKPVDVTGCELAAPINLKGVNFKTASDELLTESTLILDDIADILAVHTELIIEISGHTDSSGAATSNMQLSQRRAESVRNYLLSKGISENMLTAKGYGESLPISDNATAEGRKINRRVELKRLN